MKLQVQAIVMILQIVCLVLVIVTIVYIGKARGNLKNAQEDLDETVGKTVEFLKKMRTEIEARFKEIELNLAAKRVQIDQIQKQRDQKQKKKKRR